jgi:hypothetical protein
MSKRDFNSSEFIISDIHRKEIIDADYDVSFKQFLENLDGEIDDLKKKRNMQKWIFYASLVGAGILIFNTLN